MACDWVWVLNPTFLILYLILSQKSEYMSLLGIYFTISSWELVCGKKVIQINLNPSNQKHSTNGNNNTQTKSREIHENKSTLTIVNPCPVLHAVNMIFYSNKWFPYCCKTSLKKWFFSDFDDKYLLILSSKGF